MTKKNDIKFKFVVDVPPDKETLEEAEEIMAKAYIEKYGIENIRRVLEVLDKQ